LAKQQRLAIGIEYDGHAYKGWQKQHDQPSVQQNVENALFKLTKHKVATVCAGRTDAGVHAVGQVVHCDMMVSRPEKAWVFGGNSYLPRDIRILWAKEVANTFDARRSALARKYCYVIYNNRIRPSLFRHQISWYHAPLNADVMHMAAKHWLGEHDFSSFRDSDCQSLSPIRLIKEVKVYRVGELIFFDIIANAFLHHMIRNMVGVLLEIGIEKHESIWAKQVLMARDRRSAGITALPSGLYLMGVQYPEEFALPAINEVPWFFKVMK